MENQEIIEYGVTDAKIAELKQDFSIVPDASTEKGYAEIKSALKIISPYRTGIEAKRKELKADSLARGRLIDAEAKRITAAIVGIEQPFKDEKQSRDNELKAIEEAKQAEEAAHIAAIEQKLSDIVSLVDGLLGADSSAIQARIDIANETVINNVEFEELIDDAKAAMLISKDALQTAFNERVIFEEQQEKQAKQQREMEEKQAELDAKQAVIDQKEAEQKQKEREESLQKEAAERAKIEAEEKAQAEIDAANQREREQKEATERAQREAAETEARVKREAEAEKQRELEEAEKREANKKHKAKVNNEAVTALIAGGMNETNAKKAVTLIAKRLIPNIAISY